MWRPLCRLDDIQDGGALGFPAPDGALPHGALPHGALIGFFIVRQGRDLFGYLNSCPHIGVPLDWLPNHFLSTDRRRIICAMHGAEFTIAEGRCIVGPCLGDHLQQVPLRLDADMVLVQEEALR